MEALAKLSFVGTSVLMLVLGLRLLSVWRRTRQIPELAIGVAYVLGIGGLFLLVAADALILAGKDALGVFLCGHCAAQLSQAGLIVGVWRIFRPKQALGAVLATAGIGLCMASIAVAVFRGEAERYTEINAHQVLTTLLGVFSYGWIAVESLRYSAQLRRRRALGLADTLYLWRFRCWGVGGVTAATLGPLASSSVAICHSGVANVTWLFVTMQVLMIVTSTTTWFAFFPPAFYRRRAAAHGAEVSGRTARATGASTGPD